MPTYVYKCPIHNEFEFEHKISEKLEFCPKCEEENKPQQEVKRLITMSNFVLVGSDWAKDNYK